MYRIINISLVLLFLLVSIASSQDSSDGTPVVGPTSTRIVSPLRRAGNRNPGPTVTSTGMVAEEQKTTEDIQKEAEAKKVINTAVAEATQKFEDLTTLQGKVFFNYSSTALYEMFCKEGHISDIQLQPGEELLYVGGGDTIRWMIDKAQSGSGDTKQWHVLVKPLKSKLNTNLIITTDRHSYQIRAHASNFYNPFIGWLYPAEEKAAFLRQEAEEKKRSEDNVSAKVAPNKLCFTYVIKSQNAWYESKYSWLPKMVFDDGLKTYIQMADGMKAGEAPALFVKDDEGVNLVNYRVKDNYYIVDRIFNQAELRNGMKETVVITRNVKD